MYNQDNNVYVRVVNQRIHVVILDQRVYFILFIL